MAPLNARGGAKSVKPQWKETGSVIERRSQPSSFFALLVALSPRSEPMVCESPNALLALSKAGASEEALLHPAPPTPASRLGLKGLAVML